MNRVPVRSSNIRSVGYDPKTKQLQVEFHPGGRVYTYLDVPGNQHHDMMRSTSKGSYFARHIKGRYKHEL